MPVTDYYHYFGHFTPAVRLVPPFIVVFCSCSRNEDLDPCSHWCGHIADSSSLPACHCQPACHTGNVAKLIYLITSNVYYNIK